MTPSNKIVILNLVISLQNAESWYFHRTKGHESMENAVECGWQNNTAKCILSGIEIILQHFIINLGNWRHLKYTFQFLTSEKKM